MGLSARDVNDKQFHDAWRGYNQQEVDDFLDRVAETIDELESENASVRARLAELEEKVESTRGTEEMLKKTLASAQHAAEEAIATAQAKAQQLVGDAEERAARAREELRQRVATAEEEVRRHTEEVEREQAARRAEIEDSVRRLADFEADLKLKLRAFLDQQGAALETLLDRPPATGEPEFTITEEPSGDALTAAEDAADLPGGDIDAPVSDDISAPVSGDISASDSDDAASDVEELPLSAATEDTGAWRIDDPDDDQGAMTDFAPRDEEDAFGPGRRRRRLFRKEPRGEEVTSEER